MEQDNGTETETQADDEPDEEEIMWAKPTKPKPSGLLRLLILLVVLVFSPVAALQIYLFTDLSGTGGYADATWMQIEILPQVSPELDTSPSQEPRSYVQPDMETEVARLKSGEVIRRLVEEMALARRQNFPTNEAAASWLNNRLTVNHVGGRVVDIGFNYPLDPELSKQLVDGIVSVYRDVREDDRRKHARMMLEQMTLEQQASKDLTESTRVEMLQRLKELDTVDLAPWDRLEIETPMIRAARLGQLERTAEQMDKLQQEQRMVVDALAAKREYYTQRKILAELGAAISRAKIAEKMPRRYVRLLSKPGEGQPRRPTTAGHAPLAMLAGLAVGVFLALMLMFFWSMADRQRAA